MPCVGDWGEVAVVQSPQECGKVVVVQHGIDVALQNIKFTDMSVTASTMRVPCVTLGILLLPPLHGLRPPHQ
jgi:hypothetical protein